MEQLLRLGMASGFGTFATTTAAPASPLVGILLFAVGIIVGLSCVVAMDYTVRRQLRRDFDAWVAAGRPERRTRERRKGGTSAT